MKLGRHSLGKEARVVTCHQPTYLPWPGLFHKLALADVFIVMDTVAFSRKGWQNRNRIKGSNGVFWLTVPVSSATLKARQLKDVRIDAEPGAALPDWQRRHWESLRRAYSQARHWNTYCSMFEELYMERHWTSLSELNLSLLRVLISALEVDVEIVLASELGWEGRKSRLVLDHCRRVQGSIYVSGVNGHDYLIEHEFLAAGLSVVYQRYRPPVYQQRFGEFVPGLSAVDLLFNVGKMSGAALLAGNVDRSAISDALATHGGPVVLETVDLSSTADTVRARPQVR